MEIINKLKLAVEAIIKPKETTGYTFFSMKMYSRRRLANKLTDGARDDS